MSQEQDRKQELKIDGQEIKEKLREVVHRTETHEFHVSGDELVARVRQLLREGNIRRISIKNSEGEPIIEVPLTLGLAGALILPVWAAIGAVAALALDYTIAVEKIVE